MLIYRIPSWKGNVTKKIVKHLVLFCLIGIISLSVGVGKSSAETPTPTPEEYFTFEESTGTITRYSVEGPKDVVIPSKIRGVVVTRIGDSAFSNRSLRSVIIPYGVTHIGHTAFDLNYSTLRFAVVPDSVTDFGIYAFKFKLEDSWRFTMFVSDPSPALTYAKRNFFSYLSKYYIVTYKGHDGEILSREFTDEIDFINYDHIAPSPPIREGYLFVGWGDTITEGLYTTKTAQYRAVSNLEDYFKFDASTGTITGYANDGPKDVVIPSKIGGVEVKNIGSSAFYYMGLTSVTIPNSVTSIGVLAFQGNNLKSVILPEHLTTIGRFAFSESQLSGKLIIPDKVTEIGFNAFYKNKLTSVKIGDGVKSIGNAAFYSNQINSLTIGNNVGSIGDNAFSSNELTSVIIPDSVWYVGYNAFAHNNGFNGVTIFGGDPSAAKEYATKGGYRFIKASYDVIFQDFNGDILGKGTVKYNSNAYPPPNPTRDGYTFLKWDKDFTNVTEDLTITATYKPNQYKMIFNSNGGTHVNEVPADYESKIKEPDAPTKENHNFVGWYKDEALSTLWDFETDTVPLDGTTLYAKWALKTYTVVFKDYDGTILKTGMVEHDENADSPPNPTRDGYTFLEWDTDFTNVTEDLTVTATYKLNQYKITFNSNGGGFVDEITADYGSKVKEPDVPTLEGFTFVGWYKDEALSTLWDFETDTVPLDGMPLYAKWIEKNELKNLEMSAGKLSPSFSTSTTAYTVSVVNEVTSVTLKPTLSINLNETVTVNGQTVKSGEVSEPIPLTLGENTITIVVKENEYSTQSYEIIVTRLKSNNTNLKELQINNGTFALAFDPAIITYATNVNPDVEKLTITASPVQADATVMINNKLTTTDTITLQYGLNPNTIKVIAKDGTEKEYEVTINRLKSDNANLDVLTIDNGTLTPSFSSSTDTYVVNVNYDTTQMTVSAQVEDSKSSLTMNGKTVSPTFPTSSLPMTTSDSISIVTTGDTIQVSMTETYDLQVGSNSIPIMVKAQDGGTKIYTITVIRAAAPSRDDDNDSGSGGGGSTTPTPNTGGGSTTQPSNPGGSSGSGGGSSSSSPTPATTNRTAIVNGSKSSIDIPITRSVQNGQKVDQVTIDGT